MSLFFLFFQLFSSALLLLFNGICWVGRGGVQSREQGAGSRCGGEDDVYVNDRWPRLFELFESAKKILLSTQRRPVQTNGQTDRWSVCIVRVGVCTVCLRVCVLCVCVRKQQRVVSVLHNFISQQSLLLLWLPRCCLRCLALFPVSDAVSFY